MSRQRPNPPAGSDHKGTGRKNRGHRAKQKSQLADYEVHSQSKSASEGENLKPKGKSTRPNHAVSEIKVDAVPNPAPDTRIAGATNPSQTQVHVGVLPVSPTTTTSGFSPLPALATVTPIASSAIVSFLPSSLPSALAGGPSRGTTSRHLTTAQLVLIIIGAAFVLCAVLTALWVLARPRKRSHPVPSLPILQDQSSEHQDDDSLFGGKERTSARPGSDGILWAWTQYPHTSISNKPDTQAKNHSKGPGGIQQCTLNRPGGKPSWASGVSGSLALPSAQQGRSQALDPRALDRASTLSASIYPLSPQSNCEVGIALAGSSPVPTGALPTSDKRHSTNIRPLNRQTVHITSFDPDTTPGSSPNTSNPSAETGMAYTTPSPAINQTSFAKQTGGRVPINGSYAPVIPLRSSMSHAASRRSLVGPFGPTSRINAIVKSDARRERDTQALASVLGLADPSPPASPQTTIHPDDSITLSGDRPWSGHQQVQSSETSARLGHLMLTEFQSMASLPSSRPIAAPARLPGGSKKKTDDKPPRVPSPPPLPSLAQMALAHTNLEAFNDYKSPTYSIYGLYEANRQSHAYEYSQQQ